ncbi:oxidoreductase [Catellatospora sp. KI3]|uniref:oxidoreductase n=1 Tax=Catellatospora sp. KI3 TaxID=3041620 RepID=UPI002482570C|nr:oxidoreductase [Catellatospora sp. KI3]MDI1461924.1 oxidoreductase [Catellatospora sp. KI3]
MTMDPLAPLLELADVESAVNGARAAVDGAYKHRALRRQGGAVAAEISLRCAVASAALEGHRYELSAVRGGTVLDAVLQGALRVAEALPTLHERWRTSPRQVLARLHLLAGTGVLPEHDLGKPQSAAAPRLDTLLELVTAEAGDPLVRAAVVHGELLALQAFPGVNGIVARAAARLTLVGSGFDPRGLVPVEIAHLDREPEYIGAANAFATGTPDGLRSWLRHYTTAVTQACTRLPDLADPFL